MENRKLKKQREAAAKLSRPRPVELPSGKWRCQVMVDGRRIDVIEDDPAVAHAKALAVKAGLLEEKKPVKDLTVGEAIDRYIESKDSVLSPSTIRGYRSLQSGILMGINNIRLAELTQETVQRFINQVSKERSPKTVKNVHGLISVAVSAYRPELVLRTTLPQKEKKELHIPDIEEIQILAQAAHGTRFELPFMLATWMGLRTSEIRGLTWDCIDGDILHIKQALVMSIIMAAGNCNEVIIMSDGRWSGEGPNGERIVIDEDFKKITKLHDKLYIAFSGHVDDCRSVIKGASEILSELTSVEQYTAAVMNWIRENVDYEHTDFNAQIIVAGCNSFGKLKINAVRCYDHTLSSERNNLDDSGRFTVCSALDPTDDFVTPIMQQGKPLIEQMMAVVKEASKRNQTINDHIFYEVLETAENSV